LSLLLLLLLQAKGLDLKEVDVPVIGGHAGATILPLLSQVRHGDRSSVFTEVWEVLVFAPQRAAGRVAEQCCTSLVA
jgi:malate dehydrogenase